MVLIGTRTVKDIILKEEYEKYAAVYYTTEDGSYGEKGYPTQHTILTEQFDHIFCCGPEPMMKAVARYAYSKHIDCEYDGLWNRSLPLLCKRHQRRS